jgi:hypothetical protein
MTQITKIPESCYIGYKHRGDGEPQLGFMTPYDKTKAFDKRKETVDRWVNGYSWQNNPKNAKNKAPEILNNHPMKGFKLTLDVRRAYRYSGPDSWRVLDPRGFELEIKNENLAELMMDCAIDKGDISGECIWARRGGNNILLSVNSDEYKNAVKATKAIDGAKKAYIPMKNVKIGNKVILENGITGIYCGRMNGYSEYRRTKKPSHTFICTNKDGVEYVYTRTEVKASEILDTAEQTQKYLENQIVQDIAKGNCYAFYLSNIVKREIDLVTDNRPVDRQYNGICEYNGKYYHYQNYGSLDLYEIDQAALVNNGVIQYSDLNHYRWGRSRITPIGPITKLIIQETVHTEAGNTIKVYRGEG